MHTIDIQLTGDGAEHEAFAAALRRATRRLTVGERLKHADYEEAKKLLTDAAYAGGFLDAYWTVSELRVNPDTRQADIVLHMETGPRYSFGEVTIDIQLTGDGIDVIVSGPVRRRADQRTVGQYRRIPAERLHRIADIGGGLVVQTLDHRIVQVVTLALLTDRQPRHDVVAFVAAQALDFHTNAAVGGRGKQQGQQQ